MNNQENLYSAFQSLGFDPSSTFGVPVASQPAPAPERAEFEDVPETPMFQDSELSDLFAQAIISGTTRRVGIDALAPFPVEQQQFYLVRAILTRILTSMGQGIVPSFDPSSIVKLGPVLLKLGKMTTIRNVETVKELDQYDIDQLVQNLGITTIRRRPRVEPFILLASALESGEITDKDFDHGILQFRVKGAPYSIKFHNRLCMELAKGEPRFCLTSEDVERFVVLSGGLRSSMETFKNIQLKLDIISQNLVADSVSFNVSYNPDFLKWCNTHASRNNGESLWWWAFDLCQANVPVPMPYFIKIGVNKPVLMTYQSVVQLLLEMIKASRMTFATAQVVFRAIRKGTLLDHFASRGTSAPLIARIGHQLAIFEPVIAKLGYAYRIISSTKRPVNMIGVTSNAAANLMVKAVIKVASATTLYDLRATTPIEFGDKIYPVHKLDITPVNGTYAFPKEMEGTIVVLDTTPGSNYTNQNSANLEYALQLLRGGVFCVVVKILKDANKLMCNRAAVFAGVGRSHNSEFFAIIFDSAVSEFNLLDVYPNKQFVDMAKRTRLGFYDNFFSGSYARGCDTYIFGDVSEDEYPVVRRVIQDFSVKDDAKYVSTISVKEVDDAAPAQTQLDDLFKQYGIVIPTTKISDASSVSISPMSKSMDVFSVINSESQGKSAIRLDIQVSGASSLPVKVSEHALSATPKQAPQPREIYVEPAAGWNLEFIEANGMPVYRYEGVATQFPVFAFAGSTDEHGRYINANTKNLNLVFYRYESGKFSQCSSAMKPNTKEKLADCFRQLLQNNGAPEAAWRVAYSKLGSTLTLSVSKR